MACIFLRRGDDHLLDAGLAIPEKPRRIGAVIFDVVENCCLGARYHLQIADPWRVAGHHRECRVERLKLFLVQFGNPRLLVGLKFPRAGQIGHLRDFEAVLDDRLRVDNRHALRRRRPWQGGNAQSQGSDQAKRFIRRE